MSLELDWLEREERYRRRVTRLMTVFVILVGVLVGTGAYLRSKHAKEARQAAAQAAEQARLAEARRQRAQFVADSTAAAERYLGFKESNQATELEGLPLIAVPLPPGQPIRPFVERLWTDYTRVVDPEATSVHEITWYRQNFVDVMNDGPLRGRAVLLPMLDQSGTRLDIRKPTFGQITRGQVEVGMREPPEEAAPVDSLGLAPVAVPAGSEAPAAAEPGTVEPTGSEAAPAAEEPSGDVPAAAETSATAPAAPVPPETAPTEPEPADPAPPSAAPPDTTPNP